MAAPGAGRRLQPAIVAPRLQLGCAARAAGRFFDRRSAGVDDAGRRDRLRDRPFSRAHHPAYAPDLHHHSRRAPGAFEPPAGARGRRWGDRQGRSDLSRAGRPPHARHPPWQRRRDRARRRTADQFLQARGRPAVHLRDRCLAGRRSGRGADGHGLGRHARRQGDRRRRRQRDRPGRSHQRGVGNARSGGECRYLRGGAAARSDRSETGSAVFGRACVTPLEYEVLRRFLKERSGLDLSADKQYLVESRLIPLALKAGLSGIAELVQKMRSGNDALTGEVVEAMTTNETFFFRDKIPFDHLRATILPELLQARASRRSLRIWCAASSTGQEPYSIAMCLKEMGAALAGWRVEILATDLSAAVLEKSKAGIFSQFEVQRGLPIQMLVRHFAQVGELWQLNADIRAMVQHRQLNLLHDFSHLGSFDVIFCRNVLIYFDQETKGGTFGRLARQLETDGFLVLGAAETVVGLTDAFRPFPERRGLYRPNIPRAVPPGVVAMYQTLTSAALTR